MKFRFGILTLLTLTAVVAIFLASRDPHGDLRIGSSMSTIGERHFVVTYLTRPGKLGHVHEKLELAIIQSEVGEWPPDIEFEFNWRGKFRLHGVQPRQWPVVAIKAGDKRIELPSSEQLHEIWDGEHTAIDKKLPKELFQRFVDTSDGFARLSKLEDFLEQQD